MAADAQDEDLSGLADRVRDGLARDRAARDWHEAHQPGPPPPVVRALPRRSLTDDARLVLVAEAHERRAAEHEAAGAWGLACAHKNAAELTRQLREPAHTDSRKDTAEALAGAPAAGPTT